MKPQSSVRAGGASVSVALLASLALAWAAGCSPSASSAGGSAPAPAAPPSGVLTLSTTPPSPDPRVGLAAGVTDAGEASWNLRLLSNTPSPAPFAGATNSDLAFAGNQVIQGNYNGFMVWDVSNPMLPTLTTGSLCPASQSDVSVFRNLLFVSGEGLGGRVDCGTQGVPDSVSTERLRGIRIFDITDIANPRYIHNVQTCRGSHTHTVVRDVNDNANIYIYVSGSSTVRSPSELPGCSALAPDDDPTSARFRIEVIRVPLAAPRTASIVSSPRIFEDLTAAPRHAEPDAPAGGRGGGAGAAEADGPRPGPDQCHDITVYPEVGLAGGACRGYGLLLDISDVAAPRRLFAASDSNFALWHSATFSNDGHRLLFSDEWGGGNAPRCRATDNPEWGANAIFTVVGDSLRFESYYKLPAAQTEFENCVSHNGSLIPIPGREIMVQAWYQGGISVFDWTNPRAPREIAYFDRGPMDATRLVSAGSWSAYWYNGYIYSSEIARGLDIFEILPSGFISQNEIEAAKTVRLDYFNAQEQQRFEWPATFVLARAYLDQLERGNGLGVERLGAARAELARVEGLQAAPRRDALARLALQLDIDAQRAMDQGKVEALAAVVRELSGLAR